MNLKKKRIAGAVLVAAVTGVFVVTGGGALANGPPVVNQIDRFVDQTSIVHDVHPCTGQPAELTVTESGVIHLSIFADGTVHFTGTLRGTFSADALPTDGIVDATARFVTWFGGNGMLLEEGGAVGKAVTTSTLNGKGTNADGSTFSFHRNAHTVFGDGGIPKLELSNVRAHCP
jgi:hypothetical protein